MGDGSSHAWESILRKILFINIWELVLDLAAIHLDSLHTKTNLFVVILGFYDGIMIMMGW